MSLCFVSLQSVLVPLRGDCDRYLLCCRLFVRFPRSNTGKLKTGSAFTSKYHVAHNAVAHTMQTPVPARTLHERIRCTTNGSRTAVPIRRIVSSSLKDKTQTLVPARVPGPVPQCATMRQLQHRMQNCAEVHKSHDATCSALRTNTRARIGTPTVDV